jgi:hypothetical protein
MTEAYGEPCGNRVVGKYCHYDRSLLRHLLGDLGRCAITNHDYVNLHLGQRCSQKRETIRLIGPPVINRAVLTLYIAQFAQPLAKGREADRSLRRHAMKKADPPNSAGLLCECAAETNSCCAADERD